MPFMFLTGGPYSGKSVLLKHLFDRSLGDGIACYQFFYPTVAGEGDSIAHGLAAILHQLCRNPKLESISKECLAHHKDRIRDLRDNMSLRWATITEIANKSDEDIFCFMDGLDRASSKKPMDSIMFTSMVNNYYKSTSNGSRLRMLISARPDLKRYHNLVLGLPRDCHFNMDNIDRMHSMTEVIRTRVNDLNLDKASKNLLLESLVKRQEKSGHFAYFKTMLEVVKMNLAVSTKIGNIIPRILRRAPEELYDIYKEILNGCRNESRARKLLHLVLASFEPLSFQSLYTALEVLDDGVSGVLSTVGQAEEHEDDATYQQILYMDCGFFFTVVRGRVYLFDPAMRDFLLPSKHPTSRGSIFARTKWQHTFDPRHSHMVMHAACLNWIGRSFHSPPTVSGQQDQSFCHYACSRCLQHHSLGSFEGIYLDSSEVQNMLADRLILSYFTSKDLLDLSSPLFWHWFRNSGVDKTLLSHNWATWLMLLVKDAGNATLDSKTLEMAFYNRDDLPNCRICRKLDCEYLDPFICSDEVNFKQQFEINCGEEYEMFRLREERAEQERGRKKLPQASTNQNAVRPSDPAGRLREAAYEGDLGLTRNLINHFASFFTEDPLILKIALEAASSRGHDQVVLALLDKVTQVNAPPKCITANALQAASALGHEKVVQVLLEHGPDIDTQGSLYGHALYTPIVRGHKGIVELLLEHGADANIQGSAYSSPLQEASFRGRKEIIQVLLKHGADIKADGGRFGGALQAASAAGHEEVVQLLLDQGADVNAQDQIFGTALMSAAGAGHEQIVQILCERGADINARAVLYGTALRVAASAGHEKIVQILCERGADIDAAGECMELL